MEIYGTFTSNPNGEMTLIGAYENLDTAVSDIKTMIGWDKKINEQLASNLTSMYGITPITEEYAKAHNIAITTKDELPLKDMITEEEAVTDFIADFSVAIGNALADAIAEEKEKERTPNLYDCEDDESVEDWAEVLEYLNNLDDD